LALTWNNKNSKDAIRIEKDLMEIVPRKEWTFFSHALIWHGRRVCDARKPDCDSCKLSELCPAAFEANAAPRTSKKSSVKRTRPQ